MTLGFSRPIAFSTMSLLDRGKVHYDWQSHQEYTDWGRQFLKQEWYYKKKEKKKKGTEKSVGKTQIIHTQSYYSLLELGGFSNLDISENERVSKTGCLLRIISRMFSISYTCWFCFWFVLPTSLFFWAPKRSICCIVDLKLKAKENRIQTVFLNL